MAASGGRHALGFFIEFSSDGSNYTRVAEVVDVPKIGGWIVEAAKATHDASPDNMSEAKPGIGKTNTYSLSLNFTEAQYATLNALYRLERYWRVNFPLASGQSTPARVVVQAFISLFGELKFDPEDTTVLMTTIELTRTSGKPSYSNGS